MWPEAHVPKSFVASYSLSERSLYVGKTIASAQHVCAWAIRQIRRTDCSAKKEGRTYGNQRENDATNRQITDEPKRIVKNILRRGGRVVVAHGTTANTWTPSASRKPNGPVSSAHHKAVAAAMQFAASGQDAYDVRIGSHRTGHVRLSLPKTASSPLAQRQAKMSKQTNGR